jgi:hypothetical protein
MSCKVLFKDEIKRIPSIPSTFAAMREAVSKAFGNKVPSEFILKYRDSDNDLITVNSNEDFKLMAEVSNGALKVEVHPCDQHVLPTDLTNNSTQNTKLDDGIQRMDSNSHVDYSQCDNEMKSSRVSICSEFSNNPRVKELEEQLREVHAKKVLAKKLQKEQIQKNKSEGLNLFETCVEYEKILVELKSQKVGLLKLLEKEGVNKEEKETLKDQMINIKASTQALKEEIKEVKRKRKENKKAFNLLKGKGPVKKTGTCTRRVTKVVFNEPEPVCTRPKAVHANYYCDGCNAHPIVGPRFKCIVCHDFDYCDKCEASKPHDHAFIKIDTPAKAPKVLLTVDERPEYNNTMSVHGGDPNGHLTQLFNKFNPIINQVLGGQAEKLLEEFIQKPQEVPVPVPAPVPVVEKKEDLLEEMFKAPPKREEENIFEDIKPVPEPEVKPTTVERVARILELFPDADMGALLECIQTYPNKSDDEVINVVVFNFI